MPRDLFGDVTRPFDGAGARSRYTVPLSLLAHTAIVVAVVVVPLVAADALPSLASHITFESVTPVVPPEPPRPRVRPAVDTPAVSPDAAPTEAPEGIGDEPPIADPVETADLGTGVLFGTVEGGVDMLAPPPAPPAQEQPTRTVRPGGDIRPPQKIHDVAPTYPAIAQAARVQGVVIIQATIGPDGQVVDATVLRSIPLLDQAALEAVRQWRYTATRLNGQPVAVVMTVTVHFTLR